MQTPQMPCPLSHRQSSCETRASMWLVQVEDWETGETIVIELDPRKQPAQAVEDLYKAARKQDRTGDAIMPIMQAGPFFGIRSMDCLVLAYT